MYVECKNVDLYTGDGGGHWPMLFSYNIYRHFRDFDKLSFIILDVLPKNFCSNHPCCLMICVAFKCAPPTNSDDQQPSLLSLSFFYAYMHCILCSVQCRYICGGLDLQPLIRFFLILSSNKGSLRPVNLH